MAGVQGCAARRLHSPSKRSLDALQRCVQRMPWYDRARSWGCTKGYCGDKGRLWSNDRRARVRSAAGTLTCKAVARCCSDTMRPLIVQMSGRVVARHHRGPTAHPTGSGSEKKSPACRVTPGHATSFAQSHSSANTAPRPSERKKNPDVFSIIL